MDGEQDKDQVRKNSYKIFKGHRPQVTSSVNM